MSAGNFEITLQSGDGAECICIPRRLIRNPSVAIGYAVAFFGKDTPCEVLIARNSNVGLQFPPTTLGNRSRIFIWILAFDVAEQAIVTDDFMAVHQEGKALSSIPKEQLADLLTESLTECKLAAGFGEMRRILQGSWDRGLPPPLLISGI